MYRRQRDCIAGSEISSQAHVYVSQTAKLYRRQRDCIAGSVISWLYTVLLKITDLTIPKFHGMSILTPGPRRHPDPIHDNV